MATGDGREPEGGNGASAERGPARRRLVGRGDGSPSAGARGPDAEPRTGSGRATPAGRTEEPPDEGRDAAGGSTAPAAPVTATPGTATPDRGPTVGPELAPEALAAERVGLFGGSFDPVHRGHLTVARAALERARIDHLVVVPARISPHKLDRTPAPGAERVELLRVAFATLPAALRERVSIWTAELGREGPSFTIDTVRELARRRGPGAELPRLVLGQDSLDGLPRWRERDALLARVRLVVVERGGGEPREAALARLSGALPDEVLGAIRDGWVALAEPSTASSTALRAGLAAERGDPCPDAAARSGGSASEDLLPEVAERIRRAGLYRSADPPREDDA